jgi:sulfite reductase (NADPH) hemoprotein beta-component
VNEEEILATLKPVIEDFAKSRKTNERLGDFVIRKGYVKETTEGLNFHT